MKKEASSETTESNLETRFDAGESVLDYFETAPTQVNVNLPSWTIQRLDEEAARSGISRETLIQSWIAERLEKAPA